jgi:putative ABC transport system ATP-binding protein
MVNLLRRKKEAAPEPVPEEARVEEAPPARVVIELSGITRMYKMGDIEVHALRGVDLTIREGEFVAIMGPSGSGKSTLMNILGALDSPTSGTFLLDGEDVSTLDEGDLARVRNKKIGFVFQNFNLLKRTSALRQVELPLIYGGANNRSKRAKAALESVGLGNRIDHLPSELSGGQQQRVAIARALVNEPSMILADEPTGNLDSRSGTEVMSIFQRLNREQGITIIFVTHDPWIARHCKRVVMLRDGAVISDRAVPHPLVAGEHERPSEDEALEEVLRDAYYGGKEGEYN